MFFPTISTASSKARRMASSPFLNKYSNKWVTGITGMLKGLQRFAMSAQSRFDGTKQCISRVKPVDMTGHNLNSERKAPKQDID